MSIAEKIYSASTSEDSATARLAERLARIIEDYIASGDIRPGGVMGSLRELSERYCVGRAAFREAVALLERRGLVRLRPGPCGGLVVAQPEGEVIGAEIANYFRILGVSPTQLGDAREAVDLMAAELAAQSAPASPILSQAMATGEGCGGLDWHLRIRTAVADLTGEPVIALFVQCLNELTRKLVRVEASADAPPGTAAGSVEDLRRALEAGDVTRAVAAAERLDRELNGLSEQGDALLSRPAIETARHADDRTLATLVARRLAGEILSTGTIGQRLGSEWDLCERYSVSRATLRQAIRQLEDSGFVETRRGRGNGLVVRDLRGTGSIRLVLAYLISRQMDPMTAGTILFQLNRFVPALAVSRARPNERARLEQLLARVQRRDPIERYDLLRLVQFVSQVADSPIIDLFSRCLAAYEARFHPFLAEHLSVNVQAGYFDLLRRLLDGSEPGSERSLAWAKQESSRVMLEMSRSRPF